MNTGPGIEKNDKSKKSLEDKLSYYEQETFQLQKQLKDLAVENDTLVR